MFGFERINDVMLDYRSGTILINGKRIDIPVKVTIKESDGWNNAKIFNFKGMYLSKCPEIVIDATELQEALAKEELKNIIREGITEHPLAKEEN